MSSVVLFIAFDLEIIEERPGIAILRITGKKSDSLFANESGGHRVQRVPPNDKRGRVHTSTITVAVMPEPSAVDVVIHDKDLEIKTCRGSGAGGQHRNVTDSAVIVTHKPSNMSVRCESERSQTQNKATAIALLRSRLWEQANSAKTGREAQSRKEQVGCGARGDKRRTIRYQDGTVIDHVLNKTWRLKDYLRGDY